jgi:hypothetical protein
VYASCEANKRGSLALPDVIWAWLLGVRPNQVTETKTGRRWIDASDSDDSDDDVRAPIRSAHDKKWDGLVAATKAVNNLLKNADWNKLQDGGWVGGWVGRGMWLHS